MDLRVGLPGAHAAGPRGGLRKQVLDRVAEHLHGPRVVVGERVLEPCQRDLRRASATATQRTVPLPVVNPLHPERSKLPAIGRYFERAGGLAIVTKELAQLRALGTPPSNQADWQRLLAAKQARVTATAKQIRAALVTDVPTFIATVNTLTAVIDQERADASALGAPACAPPPENQAQGIPLAGGALSQLAACMRANGIAVQVNKTPGNGPPLTSTVPRPIPSTRPPEPNAAPSWRVDSRN